MKKRILSLLLASVLAVFTALGFASCSEEGPPLQPEAAEPEYGGTPEDIKTELSDFSLRQTLRLFENALAKSSDLSSSLDGLKLSASIPSNTLTKKGDTEIYLNDGFLGVTNNEDEYYFGGVGGSLVCVIKTAETGGEYRLSEVSAEGAAENASSVIELVRECITAAEEHFGLRAASEDDFLQDEDGFFCFTEEYTEELALAVYASAYCIRGGIEPETFLAWEQQEREAVYASARELLSAVDIRLGFGMKMRRIVALRLTLTSEDASLITDGEYDSLSLDVELVLNSTRTNVESVRAAVAYESEGRGSLTAELDFTGYYTEDGRLSSMNMKADAALLDAAVHKKSTASDAEVTVMGDRTLSLEVFYNSAFSVMGGNLIDFKYSSHTAPASLDGGDAALTDDERESLMTAKNYTQEIEVKLNTDEEKAGRIPCEIKLGTVKVSFVGSFEYGSAAKVKELPDEVKSLVETAE